MSNKQKNTKSSTKFRYYTNDEKHIFKVGIKIYILRYFGSYSKRYARHETIFSKAEFYSFRIRASCYNFRELHPKQIKLMGLPL